MGYSVVSSVVQHELWNLKFRSCGNAKATALLSILAEWTSGRRRLACVIKGVVF